MAAVVGGLGRGVKRHSSVSSGGGESGQAASARGLRYRLGQPSPLIIRYVLDRRGWQRTKGLDFDLQWRNNRSHPDLAAQGQPHQRLNHFLNSGRITKKAGMIFYMKKYRREYGGEVFNFLPPSVILSPHTHTQAQDLSPSTSNRIWIVKPSSSSQGRGIRLIRDLKSLDLVKMYGNSKKERSNSSNSISKASSAPATPADPSTDPSAPAPSGEEAGGVPAEVRELTRVYIASQYLDNPFLIHGYKFDLRLYVLVTSYHPLSIYLYREGLVRFATKKYFMGNVEDGHSKGVAYTHLTNTSINKFNPIFKDDSALPGSSVRLPKAKVKPFVLPSSDPNAATPSAHPSAHQQKETDNFERAIHKSLGYGELGKRTLTQLQTYFYKRGIPWEPIWEQIKRIIVLTLLPLTHLSPPTPTKCFELYGFDILLDAALRPWLIEVNFSPSLTLETMTDQSIKEPLVDDMIDALAFGSSPQNRIPSGSSRSQFHWQEPWTKPQEDLMTIAPMTGQALPTSAVGNFERIFPFNHASLQAAQQIAEVVRTAASTAAHLRRNPPTPEAQAESTEATPGLQFTSASQFYDHETVLLEDAELMKSLKAAEKVLVAETMAAYNPPLPPLPALPVDPSAANLLASDVNAQAQL